jgi:hypothetical protein
MREAHDKEAAALKAELAAAAAAHADAAATWTRARDELLARQATLEAEVARLGHVDTALAQTQADLASERRVLEEQVRGHVVRLKL